MVWKKGRGPVEKVDHSTGEIMCLVEVPASYKTVKKTVMVNPPGTRTIDIPAEYKTVKKRVMVEPPQERTISIPAEYDPGPVDGILGRQTSAALKSYQQDNRMAEGGLTYETVKKLGITL